MLAELDFRFSLLVPKQKIKISQEEVMYDILFFVVNADT